ncbi:acetate/propionate family kinase [Jiulongibacter sp. NS-SX5]|uniref:acetate/propionate family kinase n=1 Tax=Jiulongibacter sp. NS-SX5 TaxID=3463854 RepID=UPI0040580CFA
MSKIFVLNCGSSSLKFQLLQMPEEKVIISGLVDKIALDGSTLTYTFDEVKKKLYHNIPTHQEALKLVSSLLTEVGAIRSTEEVAAIGHRVVHGGSKFNKTTKVTEQVKQEIEELAALAPLHNPANLKGIEVAEAVFPLATQVVVFDTAFHQTIPERAYRYAIPKELADQEKIRLYGFHGTSHQYVSRQALKYLNKPDAKLVILHLGNGCSATAIQNGQSIDHSLGFGPLSGLVMGTRSGDIDPSVLMYLMGKGYSKDDLSQLLNKQSGMLGLTGSSDLREVTEKHEQGDQDATLALDINTYRIKKFIGAYAAILNGIDAVVFTAGIGENSKLIREMVCNEMEFHGIHFDADKNQRNEIEISSDKSNVKVLVIPTNEELEIAKQTYALL